MCVCVKGNAETIADLNEYIIVIYDMRHDNS